MLHSASESQETSSEASLSEEGAPAIDWPKIIQAWEDSGLLQKEFCRQQGIKFRLFTYHRTKLKKSKSSKSKLLPLKIAKNKSLRDSLAPFSVLLPTGIKLLIPQDHDRKALRQLLDILGGS